MNSDTIIADVQGFKDMKNNFIIKELSIATRNHTQTFIVKPPYTYKNLTDEEKKQVRWLEKNRGLKWSEGFIDYREFKRIVVPYLSGKRILVKGLEKILWIRELCQDCEIIELGEKGCPNFLKLYNDYRVEDNKILNCEYHRKMCALKNVLCIKKWYILNNFV